MSLSRNSLLAKAQSLGSVSIEASQETMHNHMAYQNFFIRGPKVGLPGSCGGSSRGSRWQKGRVAHCR